MNRPLFAWSIFTACLLATTSAVGWLTQSAWRADQARQQALLDSEIRNALWRLDSLAAPLLAIEANRPSLTGPFTGTPMLTPKLVNGYVVRDSSGDWTIRRRGASTAREPVSSDSPFLREGWGTSLHAIRSVDEPPADLASTGSPQPLPLDDMVVWPDARPPALAGQANQAGQMARNDQAGQEAQIRNQLVQQIQQMNVASGQTRPTLTPLRPQWVGGELVLARLMPVAKQPAANVIEICWLNWKEWEALLAAQLKGSSVPLRLQPCDVNRPTARESSVDEWRMVSLPIRLESQATAAAGRWPTPLLAVWGLLLIVAVAFGWLMQQTLALSERRAAFVSAVTHELRTPLTTFRLYTEMLSDGVVTNPEQQQTYFQTLNREANRLTHLVENVLAYARLEHGRSTARHETLTAGDLVGRCLPSLQQRVAETPLALTVQVSDAARSARLTTNAIAVEQILFNLIDNSCKYAQGAADPRIVCDVQLQRGRVCIRVSDFGPGLSSAARKTLFQAFQKSSSQAAESAPGVGLGLALSQRLAHELRGSLRCIPNPSAGLTFDLQLPLDSE